MTETRSAADGPKGLPVDQLEHMSEAFSRRRFCLIALSANRAGPCATDPQSNYCPFPVLFPSYETETGLPACRGESRSSPRFPNR